MRYRSVLEIFCCLILATTLAGCGKSKPLAGQGVWEMDRTHFEEELEQTCQLLAANHPDMDIEEFRDKIEGVFRGHRWEFLPNGQYQKIRGAFPSHGRYEVFERGEGWIIFRLYPHTDLSDDLFDYEALNQMSAEELVCDFRVVSGPVPFHVGFDFVNDTQARGFSLRVREYEVTADRRYGYLYNLQP